MAYDAAPTAELEYSNAKVITQAVAMPAPMAMKAGKSRVDYTPKPLKLTQNISVMYEMK